MSIRAALRSATWTSHQRLEKRLNVAQRFSDPLAYRNYLGRMWGFCASLERRIGDDFFSGSLDDYACRRKLPLLARDLRTLGLSVELIGQLPCCERMPAMSTIAAGFGSLYVLEGATLGGRTLMTLVEARLGFSAGHGAAFLGSYGEATGEMWQRFVAALEAWCCDAERHAQAAAAATHTFATLEHWLCGD